jgi:hypothetical protein
LNIRKLAAAAVRDAGFRHAVVRDSVVARNVLRADDARDLKFTQLIIHAHFLPGGDNEVAIW